VRKSHTFTVRSTEATAKKLSWLSRATSAWSAPRRVAFALHGGGLRKGNEREENVKHTANKRRTKHTYNEPTNEVQERKKRVEKEGKFNLSCGIERVLRST